MRWAKQAGPMFPGPWRWHPGGEHIFLPVMSEDELPTMPQNRNKLASSGGENKAAPDPAQQDKARTCGRLQSRAPRASPRTEEPTHTPSHTASPPRAGGRRRPTSRHGLGALSAGEFPVAPRRLEGPKSQTLVPRLFFLTPVPTTSPHLPSRGCSSPR